MPEKSVILALLSVGLALVTGCEGSPLNVGGSSGPIFVRNVLAPNKVGDGGCAFEATTTLPALSVGLVDVSFPSLSSYSPELLIGNSAAGQQVIVEGAVTQITDLAGDTSLVDLLATMCGGGHGDVAACETGQALESGRLATPVNPFETIESGAIEPPSTTAPSYAAVQVTIVDGATVDILRYYFDAAVRMKGTAGFTESIQLVTSTKVTGKTLSGEAVTSTAFQFPVTFSFGSLASNLVSTGKGYCVQPVQTLTSQACIPGQDAPSVVRGIASVADCSGNDAGRPASTDGGSVLGDGGSDGG